MVRCCIQTPPHAYILERENKKQNEGTQGLLSHTNTSTHLLFRKWKQNAKRRSQERAQKTHDFPGKRKKYIIITGTYWLKGQKREGLNKSMHLISEIVEGMWIRYHLGQRRLVQLATTRLLLFVQKSEEGLWLWVGYTDRVRYGDDERWPSMQWGEGPFSCLLLFVILGWLGFTFILK